MVTIAIHRNIDKRGGRGIGKGNYRRVSLNIQNYPLVEVSGYTYMVQECNCMVQDT